MSPLNASSVVLLGLLVAACGDGVQLFPEDRTYQRRLFATEAECTAFQQAGGLNCFQFAAFCRSGRAIVMVTDILNTGAYRVDEDLVTITFRASTELPNTVRFRLSVHQDTLYALPSSTRWDRLPTAEGSDCAA